MRNAVIIDAKRTVIGKKAGYFKDVGAEKLAAAVIQEILRENSIPPEMVSDVIVGNTVGPGGNLARLSALTAGLPVTVPGFTVDRQCGSGLEAVNLACRLIQSGAGDIYLAGGTESVSTSTLPKRARFSPDSIGDPDMGVGAENVAERYHITREMQDEYALLSYKRTIVSMEENRFTKELVTFKDTPLIDEGIKRMSVIERMIKRAEPAFKENGTVTAANSCGVNDGASIVLVMSEEKAEELNLAPRLKFIDAVTSGVDPNLPGIGPVPAVNTLLQRMNLSINAIDVFELNEAFAAQVVASAQELEISWDKLNKGGGAIAFGHPYGASGAILVASLLREMKPKDHYGIATIGIGGGLGIATLFEGCEHYGF
ncbi:acetyl-CoA C-acyltransferase [Fictibacillus phosphorivorans]|uniref:acetyl-CoA C-acyltransferase n=1 Tax=Fictibacillus phosphorivorans TaxID=1221500 RepID=UPI00203B4662|nr:acetyl-CoA C-acyltransferase [Fictibacillus phosphorivorans]MCM3717635.1 acetyl-CoA C-acyltransferase [Fictibacillus phosphorivorans]MCM3775535.1 acetyl-CoA C-acyltransferase [Fictibacillus phosphorivorans]